MIDQRGLARPGTRFGGGCVSGRLHLQPTAKGPASVNRRASQTLTNPKICGGFLAAVRDYFIADLSALVEAAQAGPLNGRDMDKYVPAAFVRLNKPITFCR